jgi:hypothetical protein
MNIVITLTVILLSCFGVSEVSAATEGSVDPHAAYVRYHFQDKEMDFVFGSLLLGASLNQGFEIGEAFYTATNIKDGDAASWQAEWIKTARLVESRGRESLNRGHKVSARQQFLRASYYYRAALISMHPEDERFKATAVRSRELLKTAGSFLEPQLEYIEIPFEGTVLPGYFRKAATGKSPRKTLIMIGGAETFAEDLFFYIAGQAFEHGYNFLTVDLPGQGLLPFEGKYFHRDMNVPMKSVVDYALGRQDVDPLRLAIYGYSTGGFIAPKAAMHIPQIKALAMSHCVIDGYAEVAKMPAITPELVNQWSSFKLGSYQGIAWRFGLKPDDLTGLLAANEGFVFDPAKVVVPALILVGNGEYKSEEVQRQTKLCLAGLANPHKKLVVTPAEEGASSHCILDNRSLMSQELFDWLDAAFK